MKNEHNTASPVNFMPKLAKFSLGALLFSSCGPALAQERIEDILDSQGYHQTFSYNFGQNTKPEDLDGTKIWDRNLWFSGWIDPHNLVQHTDYYSLFTNMRPDKQHDMTSLVTWSKVRKVPLFKFHYGYFEATIRFAPSPANWPAFWALSTTLPVMPQEPGGMGHGKWCEIDVYEGSFAGHLASNVHDWTAGHSVEMEDDRQTITLPEDSDFTNWNRFGALWTKDTIKFYFNGVQVNQTFTPKICQDDDMFLIISSQTRDTSEGRQELDVKNVRVLQTGQ